MMVPFDGSAPQQQQQGVAQAPLPRPPLPPGGQPSPGMQMNAQYPHGMHRQVSGPGMPPGGQYNIPPQSPGHRQQSFGMNQGQGQYSNHPPLHSPAHQQQGMHPNMTQMHRNTSQNRPMNQAHMGMPMPQQHDQMMSTSQGRNPQQYMGNQMGGMNNSMNNSMNNQMNMNNMNNMNQGMNNMNQMNMNNMNQMNQMGTSMNSSMNQMGNSMNNSMNNSMGNAMSSNMPGNSMGGGNMGNAMGNSMNSSSNNSAGLNGNWQTDRDTPHRREMIQHIVKMLKKDKNGSPEWLSKLPQMAKQLEVSLYRNARSFEAYTDMSTLKQRLQQIAVEVSRRARNEGDSSDRNRDRGQPSTSSMSQSNSGNNMAGNMYNSNQMSSNNRIVNPNEINPMANSNNMGNIGNMNMPGNMGNNVGAMGNSNYQQRSNVPNSRGNSSSGGGANMSAGSGGQNRNDPEWKVRIRHKQQRLLLLHHSAKCPHEDGRCTVTPHCADMKKLWKHMEGCKDNQCRVSHCFSSRAILSHYRKCKDPSCPACGPVRETVRRSQNRSSSGSNSTQIRSNNQSSTSSSNNNNMMGNGMPSSTSNRMMSGGSSNQQPNMMMPNSNDMNSSQSSASTPIIQNQNQYQSNVPNSMNNQMNVNNMQKSSQSQQPMQIPQQMPGGNSGPNQGNRSSSSGGGNANVMSSSRSPTGGAGMATMDGGGNNNSSSSKRNDTEWQKIRNKQQRLLLLRHASRCQYTGKCPVTPHCASMKKLWEHIAVCKNQQCDVPHCMSSRYVLSHYRRCKDPRCPACEPVRETIRKSHEKEKGRSQGGQQQSSSSGGGLFDQPPQDSSGASPAMSTPNVGSSAAPNSSPDYTPALKKAKSEHQGSMPPSSVPSVPGQSAVTPKAPITSSNQQSSAQQPAAAVSSSSQGSAQPQNSASSKPVAPGSTTSAPPATVKSEQKETTPKAKAGPKNEDRSLLNGFTVEHLTKHLESLNCAAQLAPSKLKQECQPVLKGLQQHQHGWVFNVPVDPEELGLPDYFDIIKKPMDLGSIHKKLDGGAYHSIDDFQSDVNLTFDNAMTYNEENTVVYDMAKELKTKFEADFKKLTEKLENEDEERRKNERACVLCGCEKRLFEPPVFFCNGMNCQSKRIRRNSHFYIGGNNQYFWCNQCFNELDEKMPIELIDLTIQKTDLKKKKNDEVHEESWVQCDVCNRWIHQICGLFNTRQNKEHHSEYCCPLCLLKKRKKTPVTPPPKPPCAADLPRTKLSEFLEKHVTHKVEQKKKEMAEEKSRVEKISLEDAIKVVNAGGPVTIRQVTSMDRKLDVRDRMKKRYAHKNYPDEFPFRCKCIVVFQNIDGVDVILFALYVYEHGEDNPAPNKRCVYISYLDSVHFMRPRRLRTFVYQEILIAYLDYARQRGFATAHIWACPPLKGDDYIFYAKPEDQKTPRDNRLRQWYIDMLEYCQQRSIVGTVTNMYDLYFADEKLDATVVPYLEGDYFPGEAENIIKMLEEGGGKKGGGKKNEKKKKGQAKSKNRGGTRSTGVDEEALLASGIMDGAKTLEELDRDQVMVKLGETIQPMKESFIVAFLAWSGAEKENMEVPEAIKKFREEHPDQQIPLDAPSGTKRDASGNAKEEKPPLDANGRPIKVIDDDVEDLDCEFLNNRQAFLNLCRGNHYQFDELRRAKHTSMMVLWHLHNRDAPKFVQQCVACNREILSGKRWHCASCPDYDLCESCYKDPKTNRGSCTHKLQPIAVETQSDEGGSGSSGMTEAERKQRQRNLMLHIQLIEHASRCNSSSCTSTNCAKMKNYLQHARTCKTKVQGGCRICKRIWTLLRIHAQKCKEAVCPIPQCMVIREKMRELQKQQQAMDDRRREEMNRHYRMNMAAAGGG